MQAYRGARIYQISESPGIYAWYFQPIAERTTQFEGIAATFASLLNSPPVVRTTVDLRYGVRWEKAGPMELPEKGRSLRKDVELLERVAKGSSLLREFITSHLAPAFSRPLYIGLSENLNRRICADHYATLSDYWEDLSPVSRYLNANPHASAFEVTRDLSINHSFALEARVRGIEPSDLVVIVQPLVELASFHAGWNQSGELSTRLREIEYVLQLLADPVCGRI
jgi:hypothetical protein